MVYQNLQTAKWLPNETGKQGLPAQALVEAKNEIIALHHAGKIKDQEIAGMRLTISHREASLAGLLQQYNLMKEQVDELVTHNQVS